MPTYEVTAPDGRKFDVTAPDGASQDQVLTYAKQQFAQMKPAEPQMTREQFLKRELLRSPPVAIGRGIKDLVDTGAEGLAWLYDKAAGRPTMAGMITGQQGELGRVQAMNKAGKAEFDAAVEGQALPQVARFGGNLIGTVPATNALGAVVGAIAPRLGLAIGSGGMTAGAAPAGLAARAADMGVRSAGGAVAGGVSAGMVSPDDAGTGAVIGAALPPALSVAGRAGQAVGRVIRGPEQAPQMRQAVESARELGLVLPPTQARATLGNRLVEGLAGKLTTAQNASAKNAPKVADAVARDLGIPDGIPLNMESIGAVKKAAGVLYDAVGSAGAVTPGAGYQKALDAIAAPHVQAAKGFPNAKPSPVLQMVDSLRSESFDAGSAVAKIKELRSAADDAFKPGGAGADIGRAAKAAAKALEDALDGHLTAIGEPDLLQQFRAARQLYAKATSVERAIDAVTGTVDARKLAAQLQKGKPLSGDTRKVAEAAAQFKTAFKPPEQMGSLPQLSPLDWAAGGGLGMATGNPLAALAVGARPVARAAALSPMVQNRLVQPAAGRNVVNPLLELFPRAAPVLAADR